MLPFVPFTDATPSPTPTISVDPNLVTPGPVGFLAIAIVVIVVFFIIWDMQRRIRRTRYRAEVNEQLDAEQEAAQQAERAEYASDVDDTDLDGGEPTPGR